MIRGTTPTISVVYKDKNGNKVECSIYEVFITLRDSKNTKITITNDRITFNEDLSMSFKLTQKETLSLTGGCKMQMKFKDNNDTFASNIVNVSIEDILNEEIV